MKNKDFLKECLGEAIFSLMDTMDYNKITISDIVKKAGVSRATWFRKFNNKEEAISFVFNKKWQNWIDSYKGTINNKISYTDAKFSFNFFLKNKDYCTKLYKAGLQNLLVKNLVFMINSVTANETLDIYYKNFWGFAFFGVVNCWIERGFSESIEQMQEYTDAINSIIFKK